MKIMVFYHLNTIELYVDLFMDIDVYTLQNSSWNQNPL